MENLKEIISEIEKSGIPVAYLCYPEDTAPEMPFVVYQLLYSRNLHADGKVYKEVNVAQLTLYTKLKEPETEDKVEEALSSCFWEKTEDYLDTERCYQITYEIEV